MKIALLASAAVVTCVTCAASERVVGAFQPQGDVARAERALDGDLNVTLDAIRRVDVKGRSGADLEVRAYLRVTRHDGKTGPDSLKYYRNGRLRLFDSAGRRVCEIAKSPVQVGVPDSDRRAGEWMPLSFPLDDMEPGVSKLGRIEIFDFNDIPKMAEQTGVTLEVRNARIVEKDRRVWNTRAVENPKPRTTCNPLDLSYMIQRRKVKPNGSIDGLFIECADPAIAVFMGRYWLFASHGEGYWVSDDLAKWDFIQVDVEKDDVLREFKRYAPATAVVSDTLYLCHSEGGKMLKTKDPSDPAKWELVGKPDGWMDPGMFYNDPAEGGDGYVYLDRGLSHRNPIEVLKLDPRQNMKKVDGPYDCAWPDMENRGYEVNGDNNTRYSDKDTMEGPWPVKYNGRYYLTCAVPGTAVASYCDNCFVADDPMGPFVFCRNSPVVWKNTGFTQGAGHGALFKDLQGRWWKIDTCRVRGFNRRLVLVPAEFDEKGDLYTNTVMSDRPFFVPGRSKDPFRETGPNWQLLSYGKKATASSNSGAARLAFNESMTDHWTADTENEGEWLQVDLGAIYGVWSVQINFVDVKEQEGGREVCAYRYVVEGSLDGNRWYTLVDRSKATDNRQHAYVEFAEKVGARYVRLTNKGPVPGRDRLAVCGLRVFGEGNGRPPAPVDLSRTLADRREDNNRTVGIEWPVVEDAQGYIVRYGTAPDKLHTHFQVFTRPCVIMNSLNRGVDYWYTVDSFNESGVTRGTKALALPATEPYAPGYDPDTNCVAVVNQAKGVKVHEAEAATLSGKGVRSEYEARASGVHAVHGFGAKGTSVAFSLADGEAKGAKTLRVCYSAIRDARVSVNGREVRLPKSHGWATFVTHDVPLDGLKIGKSLRFEGLGDAVLLDWVQLFGE